MSQMSELVSDSSWSANLCFPLGQQKVLVNKSAKGTFHPAYPEPLFLRAQKVSSLFLAFFLFVIFCHKFYNHGPVDKIYDHFNMIQEHNGRLKEVAHF